METNISHTSDLSSLDCWDYTIELECLRGPQGIQHYNIIKKILKNYLLCDKNNVFLYYYLLLILFIIIN